MSRWRERGKAPSVVIPGRALLARARTPYFRWWLWIPGSRFARPGMTTRYFHYTAIFRCSTGAPVVRLSAASMMALASMP